jgi:hypothetical protein
MTRRNGAHEKQAALDKTEPRMKTSEKVSLALSIVALALSVTTFVQSALADHRKEELAIRNGYSLGQTIAGYISVAGGSAPDDPSTPPAVRSALAQFIYLANSYGQNLQIDPKGMSAFLAELRREQLSDLTSANLLSSPARKIFEKELSSNGFDETVSAAYDLGWETQAYSQFCVLAQRFQTREPSLTAAFMSGYPAMLTDLKVTASKLGYLLATMPPASTVDAACRDLSSIVGTLNKRYQNS